jgi:haloalkane dehalogenase
MGIPRNNGSNVRTALLDLHLLGCCCCSFDLGAHLILEKNLMLESMPDRVNRGLTNEEMDHYRQGFTDGAESRRPILAFVRSIPVAGEPAEVVNIMDAGRKWIEARGSDLPALFVSVEPGTMTDEDREYIRGWKNVTEVAVGGGHLVTEDSPDEIGLAIDKWFRETATSAGVS